MFRFPPNGSTTTINSSYCCYYYLYHIPWVTGTGVVYCSSQSTAVRLTGSFEDVHPFWASFERTKDQRVREGQGIRGWRRLEIGLASKPVDPADDDHLAVDLSLVPIMLSKAARFHGIPSRCILLSWTTLVLLFYQVRSFFIVMVL